MYVFFLSKKSFLQSFKSHISAMQDPEVQKHLLTAQDVYNFIANFFLITGVECTSIAFAKSVRSTGNLGLKTRGSRLNFAGKYRKWRRSIWKSWWSKLHYLASFFRFWEKIWTKFGRESLLQRLKVSMDFCWSIFQSEWSFGELTTRESGSRLTTGINHKACQNIKTGGRPSCARSE